MEKGKEKSRILIADDNEPNVELLEAYLAGLNVETAIAVDGQDTLNKVASFRPHLILLDIMMPKLSGFEVCKKLKSDSATCRIMILMVTALNELDDIERAVQAGTDDFLSKPVNKAELLGPLTGDVQQQVTMMEQLIANPNTAGILLYPVDYTAIGPVAQKARDKGITVILGNGDAEDKTWRDAFVGTDNLSLGRAAADLVAKTLNGKGKVGIVSFITAQNHQDRVKGFQDRLKEAYPGIEVVGIAPEDGSLEKEAAAARAFLQAHPDVNLLWTTDAGSGVVANVIKEFNLQGKVLSVGTDRTTDQLDAIQDGTVSSTITQDTYAEQFISLLYLWLAYNNLSSLPDTTVTKPLIITKDNIDSQMKSPAERFAVGWPK